MVCLPIDAVVAFESMETRSYSPWFVTVSLVNTNRGERPETIKVSPKQNKSSARFRSLATLSSKSSSGLAFEECRS